MNAKNQQIIKSEENQIIPINSPDNLLALAIEKGADLAQLEKLMDLKERYDAGLARKAFYTALAHFQANLPAIIKKKQAYNYLYAPLGDIAEQIRKPLQEAGLSYRFEMDHAEELITVTSIITHVDGHSERTSMNGMPDDTGSKNTIQSNGSTVTYLQRYTLISALGLTTADEDMDGRLPDTTITTEQEATINAWIKKVGANKSGFLKMLQIDELCNLPVHKYEGAIKRLEDKGKAN